MKKPIRLTLPFLLLAFVLVSTVVTSQSKKVYVFNLREEIAPPAWRNTQNAFRHAEEENADLVLIHMNTYGGQVDIADSIRTRILQSTVPVFVFIDHNAASAGALIALACDSIYMKAGGSIGAATVVNQAGEVVPDKFQSYMRSMMRSTAETNGRDPMIAQAMVDPSIYIAGISDSGKVLTFTTNEAITYHFCEGSAFSVKDVLRKTGYAEADVVYQELNVIDRFINFLLLPVVSGLLIMVIIGGIYFELQTPGIGFPMGASIVAALLYFAPLYLEGLAMNWEIMVFVVGVILLLIEIFAIPGFGITGVLSIVGIVGGLTFALLENIEGQPFSFDMISFVQAFFTVISAIFVALSASIYLSKALFGSQRFGHFALKGVQLKSDGYTSASLRFQQLKGLHGTAVTILRPAGKVDIEGELFDAVALNGYISEGEAVEVIDFKTGQVIVQKI